MTRSDSLDRSIAPRWERAWNGHVLRAAHGTILARIIRLQRPATCYAWATDNRSGSADSLRTARAAVSAALKSNTLQLELFARSDDATPAHLQLLQRATTEQCLQRGGTVE
jgi:hypothetical protein